MFSNEKSTCSLIYSSFSFVCFSCVNHQDDMERRAIWEENKQLIEDNNRRFLMGMKSFSMAMNRYGDLVRSIVLF